MKQFWQDYGRDLAIAYLIMALAVAVLWCYVDYVLLGGM